MRAHDQFRITNALNPELTYSIEGLALDDNQSDFNVTVITSVSDGIVSEGIYDIEITDVNASQQKLRRYIFSYLNGKMTVSDKGQQEIIFDQNLSNVTSITNELLLTGFSTDMDGNTTNLPITYEVEDASVARILVTEDSSLWPIGSLMRNFITE